MQEFDIDLGAAIAPQAEAADLPILSRDPGTFDLSNVRKSTNG